MTTALWWIRRDLRLTDNQALLAALAHANQVIPVFVLDPALLESPYVGEKRLAFLFGGFRALNAHLRARGSQFGFGGIFVITQMHGLGLSRRVRWIILALYIAAALVAYGLYDLTMIHQITWIPIVECLGVLILAGIFGAGLWVAGRIKEKRSSESQAASL